MISHRRNRNQQAQPGDSGWRLLLGGRGRRTNPTRESRTTGATEAV